MKKVIFIGGATGSGKTTFTNCLSELLTDSIKYRRVQGFYDLAEERGVKKEDIYYFVEASDVDKYFVKKVLENDTLISDIHYAVQMERNDISGSTGNMYSKYVPTISNEFINLLLENDIEIYFIYISCNPAVSFDRALKRFKRGEKELRNNSIEDITMEINAEKRVWNNLPDDTKIHKIELFSDLYLPEELANQFVNILNKKEKVLVR